MEEKESRLGFTRGIVAKSLRKILFKNLTDHEVECITVILICHLMVEQRMGKLLYEWMSGPIPIMGREDKEKEIIFNDGIRSKLYKNIERLNFSKKVDLIRPLAEALWDKDGKEIIDEISDINEIRNNLFHRLTIKELKFKNKLINTEDGIEEFFQVAQQKLGHLDHLIEFIETKK